MKKEIYEEQFKYLIKRKTLKRMDIAPWILIYAAFIYFYNGDYIDDIISRLIGIAIILLHGLFSISSFWSHNMKALIEFSTTNNISKATHALVVLKRK